MKIENVSILFTVFLLCAPLHGQTNFVYDQQSSDENHILEGGTQIQPTLGQSFTPALPVVGFIRLFIYNGIGGDTSQTTIYLDLYAGATNGLFLGSTAPVLIPSGLFVGMINFIFTNPIPINAGDQYSFRPIVNRNNLGMARGAYNYSGGTVIYQGTAYPEYDFWFREGIIAPKISIELTNEKPLLRFSTFSNQNYSVEHSPDLSSGSWSNLLGTNIIGNGQEATLLDTNVTMSVNRFYRLKLFP